MCSQNYRSPVQERRSLLRTMYGWLLDIWNGLKAVLSEPTFWIMLAWVLIWVAVWRANHG